MRAVNLIPADQRGGAGPAAGRSQGVAYAVPVLLGGLALMVLFYGTAHHEIKKRTAQAAALSAETQQAQARATQLTPYTAFLTLHQEREQAVVALSESRFDWSYAFHELGAVLPDDVSISSLSGTVGTSGSSSSSTSASSGKTSGPAVTSATPPGAVPTFELAGCATSQAEVARTLNRLRLIDGVSEVTLQSSTKPGGASTGGGGGGCSGKDPTFAMTVIFNPLPTPSATTATATTKTAAAGGAG
jgi:Tfp pilus assembly protein PilN